MTELDELKYERAKAWDDYMRHEYVRDEEALEYLPKYKRLDKRVKEAEARETGKSV